MKEKTVNYTETQVATMVGMYCEGRSVAEIAAVVGHSEKSVVAKLVREKVYVSKAKKAGVTRVTKAMLIASIAANVGASEEALESLEKATKEALELLNSALAE